MKVDGSGVSPKYARTYARASWGPRHNESVRRVQCFRSSTRERACHGVLATMRDWIERVIRTRLAEHDERVSKRAGVKAAALARQDAIARKRQQETAERALLRERRDTNPAAPGQERGTLAGARAWARADAASIMVAHPPDHGRRRGERGSQRLSGRAGWLGGMPHQQTGTRRMLDAEEIRKRAADAGTARRG